MGLRWRQRQRPYTSADASDDVSTSAGACAGRSGDVQHDSFQQADAVRCTTAECRTRDPDSRVTRSTTDASITTPRA